MGSFADPCPSSPRTVSLAGRRGERGKEGETVIWSQGHLYWSNVLINADVQTLVLSPTGTSSPLPSAIDGIGLL